MSALLGFQLAAFALAIFCLVLMRWLGLSLNWLPVLMVGLVVVGFYLYAIVDARQNPWVLWKRQQDSGGAEQYKLGRYATQEECVKVQWKKLEEELEQAKQIRQMFAKIALFASDKRVHLVEGRTIFEYGPSFLASMLQTNRTDQQKDKLPPELLLPEIHSTVSFYCAPSLRYAFWPFYNPTYYASADDLRRLGERTLATRAKEMIGE